MADPIGIKVTGARELRRTAKKVGGSEANKTLRKGHKEIAGIVAPTAKRNAPKRSGKLAGNIRPSGTVSKAQIVAGGARVPYAGAIHGGWPARNIEPQPFMTDAVSEKWDEAYDALEDLFEALGKQLSTT